MSVSRSADSLDRRLQRGPSAGATTCSLEDFLDRRRLCVLSEPSEQILLERHAGGRGSASERGVDIIGNVFDLDARHNRTLAPIWRQNMKIDAIAGTWSWPMRLRHDQSSFAIVATAAESERTV